MKLHKYGYKSEIPREVPGSIWDLEFENMLFKTRDCCFERGLLKRIAALKGDCCKGIASLKGDCCKGIVALKGDC